MPAERGRSRAMFQQKDKRSVQRTVLSIALLLLAGYSHAQVRILEEVLVTAQKREQNVQAIPVTVNVVDAQRIDSFSIRDTADLADSVPGLTIQPTPQNLAQITLRGLGTGSASESLDQSVGLFVDGIWSGRVRDFQASLFDLERVEVIKGTQNTLLGKNSSVGALSILSRKPGPAFSGYLQADYETEFDSANVTGAINLPSRFGLYRLAFNSIDEAGYVSNRTTRAKVPERRQTTLRLAARYAVGEEGNLDLTYEQDDLTIRGDTFQPDSDQLGFMQSMDPSVQVGLDNIKNAFTSYSRDGDADDEQQSRRAVAQYDQPWGELLFTSITGWSAYDNERLTDTDFLSVDYLTSLFASDYEQFTQELRVASPLWKGGDYLLGIYYHQSNLDYRNITDSAFPAPFTVGPFPVDSASLLGYRQDTQILSLFGQTRVSFGGKWALTFGLRYTEEEKDAVWERERLRSGGPAADILADLLTPVVPETALVRSEYNLDGSASLQYDVSERLTTYLSWASGSKSGGFSSDVAVPAEAEFDTEKAQTTELGMKWQFGQGAGVLNTALFFTEIDDFQVVSFIGTGFLTSTVPARSAGLEMEAQWLWSADLLLGATLTYADAQEQDTSVQLPYAPKWSASMDASWTLPFTAAGLEWRLEGVVNYRSKQFQQRLESNPDAALTLLDLRLALAPPDGRWELALLGRNLLDESSSFGFDFPFFGGQVVPGGTTTIGSVSRPRSLTVQACYSF